MQNIWAIILAAGSGLRITDTQGLAKQFLEYKNEPLYLNSAKTFTKLAKLQGLVFVFPKNELKKQEDFLRKKLSIPFVVTSGGETRQISAYNGLKALPKECDYVFIHDAARPLFSAKLAQVMLEQIRDFSGLIPAIDLVDTICECADNTIKNNLKRELYKIVQTPQLFKTQDIILAHKKAKNAIATDDASLLKSIGLEVKICDGEEANIKITHNKDLAMLATNTYEYRTTYGEDIHKYTSEDNLKARPLKIGGVEIPGNIFVEAHSDGDVLLHALTDALLAQNNSPDIGQLFSDKDIKNSNLSSAIFLDEALNRLQNKKISFVDLTIVCEKPKIAPHCAQIIKNIARLMQIDKSQVALKAKTAEGLDSIGEGKAIKAIALVNCKIL